MFAGADGIFALTGFWQTQSTTTEIAQGRAIVDAAARSETLKHFVWSALPDPVKLSNGQLLNIHHWKGKSLVTEYIQKEHPKLWAKTTTVLFPNYFENCITTPGRYLPKKVNMTQPQIISVRPSSLFTNRMRTGFTLYLSPTAQKR